MKFEKVPGPEKKIGEGGYKNAYRESLDSDTVHLVLKHEHTNKQIKGLYYRAVYSK